MIYFNYGYSRAFHPLVTRGNTRPAVGVTGRIHISGDGPTAMTAATFSEVAPSDTSKPWIEVSAGNNFTVQGMRWVIKEETPYETFDVLKMNVLGAYVYTNGNWTGVPCWYWNGSEYVGITPKLFIYNNGPVLGAPWNYTPTSDGSVVVDDTYNDVTCMHISTTSVFNGSRQCYSSIININRSDYKKLYIHILAIPAGSDRIIKYGPGPLTLSTPRQFARTLSRCTAPPFITHLQIKGQPIKLPSGYSNHILSM